MKGIYIIIGIAVLGLVALMLFSKKSNGGTAGTAGNDGTEATDQGGGFGSTFGANFGVLRQSGQSFSNWFNTRQQQGWEFNTSIV